MEASSRLPADEPILGVVCSDGLRRGDDSGYGVVVTRHRIMGSKKPDSMESFEAYVASGAAESTVRAARIFANGLLATKDFEVSIGSVGQVLFKNPGLFSGGYAVIKTSNRTIRVETRVSYVDPRIAETMSVLCKTLYAAVGWRLSTGGAEKAVVKLR